MAPGDLIKFDSIQDSIEAFQCGEFIIVLDSPSRENEGDLVIAASKMTPEKMAFMVYHTSGLICTPILPYLAEKLNLPQMVSEVESEDPNKTAYTISIDANHPTITTGISAHDRALTCNTLASSASAVPPSSSKASLNHSLFRRPGHIFPLRAHAGLTRARRGHTEAALEFCRLAGLPMVGVISELVESGAEVEGKAERKKPDMMRGEACLQFAKHWGLKCCSIDDLVKWLEINDQDVRQTGENFK
ncbi:3,4-dihydroxy-2-butanone 4-phosphate synthase [Golovinomyces cichoracearum]|uniref:3,4-dihydroxy-2-butanone 4-phosphate synthase n=1 Tax=Golovinomyces cichoracearum TaxID=62708 RepID=A0A420I0N4_9PEZI|nr:3,4-dihydroxy-2-butanone 4-phosphate synthase [Golovinomyces cichoracearum]